MTSPKLKTVSRTRGNNQALKDGTVAPRDFVLDFEDIPVLVDAFRRMVRALEFDVCEMAFTTYLCAKAHGKPFTGLPIFLVRGFHHAAVVRNAGSRIRSPKDLEGERVGVNRGYTVTTGVWARGILHDEYDVDLNRITWMPSGDEHVAEFQPPENVVPMEEGRGLRDSLAAGDLAAGIGITADYPDLEPLIPGATEAAFDSLRQRGLYPINHLVVVKDELLEEYPNLAPDLFGAFVEAKTRYLDRLRGDRVENPTPTDFMYRRVMDVLDDPLPYGIEPNREMINTLVDHAVHQRILDRPPEMEALFAGGTRDLTG